MYDKPYKPPAQFRNDCTFPVERLTLQTTSLWERFALFRVGA
jgi:hypothetical protein